MARESGLKWLLISCLLINNYNGILCGTCPPESVISPCTCSGGAYIECKNIANLDLRDKLLQSSWTLSTHSDKQFEVLYVQNTGITELADNTFVDLTFTRVMFFDNTNLDRIRAHAFTGPIHSTLEYFWIQGSRLDETKYNTELFDALSSLPNVKTIDIRNHKLTAIPSRAFKNINGLQNQLTSIDFFGGYGPYPLQSIGAYAFADLPNIQNIKLRMGSVSHIEPNAFYFHTSSDTPLTIDLEENALTSNSFGSDAFINAKRPLIINLHNNKIDYLNESVYEPILRNKNNVIMIYNLVCDCRMKWIVANKVNFNVNQLPNARCTNFDHKSIWDLTLNDLPNC
jgi:hypothetical protein